MKPILNIVTVVLLSIYSPRLCAQASFGFAKSPLAGGSDSGLYKIKAKSPLNPSDTFQRVVHIYKDQEKVSSYKLRIISDSSGLHVTQTDSAIHDLVRYQQLVTPDSTSTREYKTTLVNSADLTVELPIEDLYNHRDLKGKLPALPLSLKGNIDTPSFAMPKVKPLTVHGSVTTIGQFSDNKYLYQEVPQNYVRTYVNADIEAFGLPFSSGYYYSTESNSGLNKLNNFRFSFNYDKFYSNLKRKIEHKQELDKIARIKNVTRIDIGNLNKEFSKLQGEIGSKEFKRSFQKNIDIMELGERDTSFKRSYKYKKTLQKQQAYDAKLARLKEIEKLKEDYLKYTDVAEFDSRMKGLNVSKPQNFRKAARRYGFIKPGQSIFLSVKKLDLGTFDPDYSVLVLSGVSLTGVNIELNPGNLYGAFTWGKAVANFDNPFNFSALAGGRTILSGRIGLGRKEKLLVAMSVLKGKDDDGNRIIDSSYNYYLPNYNYVVGVDVNYKISSSAELGIEYAKSQNKEVGKETGTEGERIGNLVKPEEGKYSSAWYAYTKVNFNENTTRLKASSRLVDPFYYSFGTPYLRRDNFRIELKGEQLFWKNQLTAGVTYRRDRDNLYGLKQGTSTNNTFIFTTQLRIKKYPYLILTYSPNYQSFYNSALKKQINSNVKLYNAVVGYTYQQKKLVANSTFSYTRQLNESNQAEWQPFDVSQYAFYENVTLRNVNLMLNSGITYALPKNQGDTGRIFSANAQGSKGLFNNKLTVIGGYRYQKDFTIEERNIVEGGTNFGLGWGITCQVMTEKHFIKPYAAAIDQRTDMWLGRITLIKTF
jgi:hypothetical protein